MKGFPFSISLLEVPVKTEHNVMQNGIIMKLKVLILLAVASLGACKQSSVKESAAIDLPAEEQQQRITLDEYCASNQCRENVEVKLRTDGDEIDQLLLKYWPVVQGEELSILPNETIYIEATIVGEKLTNFKQVGEIANPEITLKFSLSQMDGRTGMMLSVNNPFNKAVKFHLNMIDFSGNPHQTSSCPVMPGSGVFESWGHPIPELNISNIHILEESEIVGCVY